MPFVAAASYFEKVAQVGSTGRGFLFSGIPLASSLLLHLAFSGITNGGPGGNCTRQKALGAGWGHKLSFPLVAKIEKTLLSRNNTYLLCIIGKVI